MTGKTRKDTKAADSTPVNISLTKKKKKMLEEWFKNKEGPAPGTTPGSSRPGSVLRKKKKNKKKGSQSNETRQS